MAHHFLFIVVVHPLDQAMCTKTVTTGVKHIQEVATGSSLGIRPVLKTKQNPTTTNVCLELRHARITVDLMFTQYPGLDILAFSSLADREKK